MRAINEMASATLRPLVVPVRPGSTSRFAVWQHRQTGQIELQGDMRWSPNSECEGEPQWEQVIGRYADEFGPRCGDEGDGSRPGPHPRPESAEEPALRVAHRRG
jgi:hypothetical protein